MLNRNEVSCHQQDSISGIYKAFINWHLYEIGFISPVMTLLEPMCRAGWEIKSLNKEIRKILRRPPSLTQVAKGLSLP